MSWVFFAFGAMLSWGVYGPSLAKGQVLLGNPMRALLCVGLAYFLIAILVPIGMLGTQGGLSGFNTGGFSWATVGGALGALGAIFVIFAFRAGGTPNIVMPIVFGGAPVVNTIVTMISQPPKQTPNPLLYVGFALVSVGAGLVLYYKPH